MSAHEHYEAINKRLLNLQKEKELLGHIINKPVDQLQLLLDVKKEFFFKEEHAMLFELMQGLFHTKHDITFDSLHDFINIKIPTRKKTDITALLEDVRSEQLSDTVFNSISLLHELYKNRLIYSEVLVKANMMFQENLPIEEIIDHMSKIMISIDNGKKEHTVKSLTDNIVESILDPIDQEKGLDTGLHSIDVQFGGVKKDRYYAIGGESGGGKTAVIVDIIERLCTKHSDKIKIIFFSMEMSEGRIIKRLISRKTQLSNQLLDIKKSNLSAAEREGVKKAGALLKDYPLEIVYDTMDCRQIKMRVRKFAIENKGKHLIVMLDHIGLVVGETNDMRVNTINASSTMKSFCRDYDASVFVLTQFTKEIDSMDNKKNYHRPHMGYIMESGRIRQDADAVWLIWRPETRFAQIPYGSTDELWDTKDKIIMLNEKNRDGQAPTDMIFNHNIACSTLMNSNTNSHEVF